MSVLEKLTEGIVDRDLAKEGAALQSKWEKTGLLEGITSDRERASMSRLLENQAKELLREASTMAAGDVEGFAAVAFPIVRRVFGGLLANDLVSVQPMSLPSGLIFFLDFTYTNAHQMVDAGDSLYGGGVVGNQLTGGVSEPLDEEGGGFYNLANAYSSPTGSATGTLVAVSGLTSTTIGALTEAQKKLIRYDPDILAKTSTKGIIQLSFGMSGSYNFNEDMLGAVDITTGLQGDDVVIRRLTSISGTGTDKTVTFTIIDDTAGAATTAATQAVTVSFPVADNFDAADAVGGVKGTHDWPLELATDTARDGTGDDTNKDLIPEIDIKVDSIAVTAVTKKLKAKWSPELGQDLNAYHNLDAEVELTSILSEQIALEIDREIVNDLIQGATAGTYYWSRSPGLFVNRSTGAELGATSAAPDFTGTVSEWYETLIETINDVSAQIHRKTLRGGANFLVTSPEVANILEFTAGFRANVTHDSDRGTVGAVNVGSVSKKFDVYVDPYFPRNVVLVGRKGGSFLESGYVYAPYVPLQVTPTIFGTEDFVPRKGVMTRYAKKMVRPDMYGLVVCRGLLGESGS